MRTDGFRVTWEASQHVLTCGERPRCLSVLPGRSRPCRMGSFFHLVQQLWRCVWCHFSEEPENECHKGKERTFTLSGLSLTLALLWCKKINHNAKCNVINIQIIPKYINNKWKSFPSCLYSIPLSPPRYTTNHTHPFVVYLEITYTYIYIVFFCNVCKWVPVFMLLFSLTISLKSFHEVFFFLMRKPGRCYNWFKKESHSTNVYRVRNVEMNRANGAQYFYFTKGVKKVNWTSTT